MTYLTFDISEILGPGPAFCWVRVRFLETSSSPRPSVTFFSPSADRPSAYGPETVVTVEKRCGFSQRLV